MGKLLSLLCCGSPLDYESDSILQTVFRSIINEIEAR